MGYQELNTPAGGKKMVVPTFLNIGEDGKVTLADLKVTGYTAPSKNNKGVWINGCKGGEFVAEKLTVNGTREAGYYWIDTGTVGPGWFANAEGGEIPGGAAEVKYNIGVAFWTQGSGYKLVPAGAVNEKDIAYVTPAGGKVAVGNSTPVDITLADLSVTGYTPPSKNNKGVWINGCKGGEFVAEKLTVNGTREAGYYWIDTGTVGPGWFANAEGGAIDGGAASVSIPAGQGLWTQGSGYTLTLPGVELDAKKED